MKLGYHITMIALETGKNNHKGSNSELKNN